MWKMAVLLSDSKRGGGLLINGDEKVGWPKLLFPIFGLALAALHK